MANNDSNGLGDIFVFGDSLGPADDFSPDNTNTNGTVAVGGSTDGSIETTGDFDWFRVALTAGQTYQIDVGGVGGSPLVDPIARLRDPGGTQLTFDNNSGPGQDARITVTADQTATHYLQVNAAGNNDTGDYQVSVTTTSTSLEVTTLDDVINAGDGVLSLREAVEQANASPGPDTITFADTIRGGTIALESNLGTLAITDDLTIDGDPLDGGSSGIVVDGGQEQFTQGGPYGVQPFSVAGANVRLEDLSIVNSSNRAITADNSAAELDRVAIDRITGFSADGIDISGGTVDATDTRITGVDGWYTSAAVSLSENAEANINNSVITDIVGEASYAARGNGSVTLIDSEISEMRALYRPNVIDVDGDVTLTRSTITEIVGIDDTSTITVQSGGTLDMVNSTIAGIERNSSISSNLPTAISGTDLNIVNSTITGVYRSVSPDGPTEPGIAISVPPSASANISNSIIDGTIIGLVASGGGNTFQDASINAPAPSDSLGVNAEDVFAVTQEIGTTGTHFGVLADNGGPTRTVALLDDAANPARNAADPAIAPATDQRGVARDATPDSGAFELGGGSPAANVIAATSTIEIEDSDGLVLATTSDSPTEDETPAETSSPDPAPALDLNPILGSNGPNILGGTADDDIVFGFAGNDRIDAGGGDILVFGPGTDALNGGAGLDIAVLEGNSTDYAVDVFAGVTQIREPDVFGFGDSVFDIEILQFDDGFLDFSDQSFTQGFANDRVEALMTTPGFTTDPTPAFAATVTGTAPTEAAEAEPQPAAQPGPFDDSVAANGPDGPFGGNATFDGSPFGNGTLGGGTLGGDPAPLSFADLLDTDGGPAEFGAAGVSTNAAETPADPDTPGAPTSFPTIGDSAAAPATSDLGPILTEPDQAA